MKVSRLTRCAVFASAALIIYSVETALGPLVPIPGFRIGLSNMVTLAALYILGFREALLILAVRILLGNMLTGQMMSLVYSLCGGALSFGVSALIKRFFPINTIWALGIIGAVLHTAGQIACACVLFDSNAFVYYGIFLTLLSFVSGLFTGLCAQFAVKFLRKNLQKLLNSY